MIAVLQPEIAYVRTKRKPYRKWDSDPPEGHFFYPKCQEVPNNISKEDFFQYLQHHLIPLEFITHDRTIQD